MGAIITLILLGVLGLGLFIYEKKKLSTSQIALIATLGAFAGVSRIPFAALPGIQPTTFLVILSGMVLGTLPGFMVGVIAAAISSAVLGYGPYVVWQMLSWGLAGAVSGIIFYKKICPSKIIMVPYCFIWGFLFDYIMNFWHFLNFVFPHNITTFIAVYSSSFFHDFAHSASNGIFAFIFGKDLFYILKRFEGRLHGVQYED